MNHIRPTIESLEERTTPTGLGWVIDADPFSFNGNPGWATDVAVDSAGDIYVAGGGAAGLIKYNSDGSLAWAKTLDVKSLCLDSAGNVLAAGQFSGTLSLGAVTLSAQGGNDGFVICLDPAGDALWGHAFGGANESDLAAAVAADAAGNAYVTGQIDLTPGNQNENFDVFIAKLDAVTGNTAWYEQIGGSAADGGNGIALDHNGNLIVCGNFHGTMDFDPGSKSYTLNSGGRSVQPAGAAFILKLANSGGFIWADCFQAANWSGSGAYGVAVDGNNNVYVAGSFAGSVDFNPGNGKLSLSNAGGSDIYAAKLSSTGSLIWARSMGGSDNDGQYGDLTVDLAGNLYLTGNFGGTTASFGSFTLTSNGGWDIYVTKLDTNGNFAWAIGVGGTGTDLGDGIALDSSGNIFVVGLYSNTVDFDPGPGADYLTSTDGRNSFLWELVQT